MNGFVCGARKPGGNARAAGRPRCWRALAGVVASFVTIAGGLGATAKVASAATTADNGALTAISGAVAVPPPTAVPVTPLTPPDLGPLTGVPPTYPPPDLINPASLEASATNLDGQYYPGGIYSATPAQQSSLENLEDQAVQDTVALHQLGSSDGPQVMSWGRQDALAMLWSLIYEDITSTSPLPGQSAADQQNVVAWLQAVAERNNILSADDAGLEYTKWAGLSVSNYEQLLASGPSEAALQSFFAPGTAEPLPYTAGENSGTPQSANNEGYCLYQAPAPYQAAWPDVYSNGAPQICYTPSISFGSPTPPTTTDFEDWGQADVTSQLASTPGWTSAAAGVAEGYTQLAVAAATTAGTALLGACAGCVTLAIARSGPLGQSLFPFALRTQNLAKGGNALQDSAETEAVAEGEAGAEEAEEVVETAEEVAAVGETVLDFLSVAAAYAGPVAALIEAIVLLVTASISVNQDLNEPGQLASLVTGAYTEPDLSSLASSSNSLSGLYALFIGSTLPTPAFGAECDDSSLIDVQSEATGTNFGSEVTPCMNAPTPLADLSTNPQWVVTPEGSTSSTTEPTVTWQSSTTGLATTTYLAGNWFVDTATPAGLTPVTVQSLQLDYVDWHGNDQVAWLINSSTKPVFVVTAASSLGAGFDPNACLNNGACSLTSSIELVGPNGQDFSASVSPGSEPPAPPAATDADPTEMRLAISPTGSVDLVPGHGAVPVTVTAAVGSYAVYESGLLLEGPEPQGTVSFFQDGLPVSGCQGMALSIGSDGDGAVTCGFFLTAGGLHTIVALYSGAGAPGLDSATAPTSASATITGVEASLVQVPSSVSPVVGQPVTYTAQVEDLGPSVPPSGTVTFTGGDTAGGPMCPNVPLQPVGAGTAASVNPDGSTTMTYVATCTYTYKTVPPLYDAVDVSYSGDTYTLPSLGGWVGPVAPAPTTTTVEASPASPVIGEPVTFTATVSAPGTLSPSGTVTFSDAAGTICAAVALTANASTASGASSTASCTETYSSTGTETVTASFSAPSAGPTSPPSFTASSGSETLNVQGMAASSTSITASTGAPVVSQDYRVTATVTSGGAAPPTGTVDFYATVYPEGSSSPGSPVPVCTGVALSTTAPYTASCQYGPAEDGAPGPVTVSATYSGDAKTAPSSSTTTLDVEPQATLTALTASEPVPSIGEAVTYTAYVSAAPPATSLVAPSGDASVTFSSGGTTICPNAPLLPADNTSGTFYATCTQTYLLPGAEDVAASYSGDSNTLPSSASTSVDVSQTVPSAPTSLSAADTGVGQVNLSWDAPSSDGGLPVIFYLVYVGTSSGHDDIAVCGAAPPSTTCTATGLPGGSPLYFTVVAVNLLGGSAMSNEASVTPEAPLGVTTSSLPDGEVGAPGYSATLAATGGLGPYTWSVEPGALPPGLSLDTSTGAITGTPTSAGTFNFAATVTDSNPGTPNTATASLSVTVDKAATSTALGAPATSASFGKAVNFTASVAPASPSTAGPAPTGSVTFSVDGQQLGSPVVLSGGQAQETAYNLAPGAHVVSATYSGDGNYTGSSGTFDLNITCSQTITSGSSGAVKVTGSTCVEGGSVSGPVNVPPGGALALVDAKVSGPITANGAASVLVCGTSISGPVTISSSSGPVDLGGPIGSSCAPDHISGPVTVQGSGGAVSLASSHVNGPVTLSANTDGVTVTGSTIGGPLTVRANAGAIVVSSDTIAGPTTVSQNNGASSPPVVSTNTVQGPLACSGNSPAPVDAGEPNQASGPASGQCASLA